MTVPQSTCCGNKLTNFAAPMVNFKSEKPTQVEKPKAEIHQFQVKEQKPTPIEIKVSPKLKYEPRSSVKSIGSSNSIKKAEKIEAPESPKISRANKYSSKNNSHTSVHKESREQVCPELVQKELINAYVKTYVKSYLADFKRLQHQQANHRSRSAPRQPNQCRNAYPQQKMYYNVPNQYSNPTNNCRNYILFAT